MPLFRGMESLAASRQATSKHPRDPECWQQRADLAEKAGAVAEAVDALFHVADLYALSGMRNQAVGPIQRILRLDPNHDGARRLRRLVASPADELEGTRPGGEPAASLPPLFDELLALGTILDRRAGQVILTEGEFGRSVYVLLAGTVAVSVTDAAGAEMKLAELGPGSFIGELSFLMGARRTATVTARTDVQLVELRPEILQAKLLQDRRLLDELSTLARRRLTALIAASLTSAPRFSGLTREQRRELLSKMRMRRLRSDEVLIHRGQKPEGLYFVALGRLERYVPGSPARVLGKLGRGDVYDGNAASVATVRALEPSCVLVLPQT